MNAPIAPEQLAPQDFCRRARPLLGTLVEIHAHGNQAEAAVKQAFDVVATVHRLMSYHDPDSDVSRINRDAARAPVPVHPWTWQVLAAAREFSAASAGVFDITVAPTLTRLGYLPRHPDFPRCSGQGDWRHIELLPENQVRLTRCLRIDLGGIAKGFAVDCAIAALRSAGVTQACVNAGGDLRCFGEMLEPFAIRHPGDPARVLPLGHASHFALATSAGYYAAKRQGGQHITPHIDPRTRRAHPPTRSVSVAAADAMTADALTKIMLLAPAQRLAQLTAYAAQALVLDLDPRSGNWRIALNTFKPQP